VRTGGPGPGRVWAGMNKAPGAGQAGDEQCPQGRARRGLRHGSIRPVGKGNSLPKNAGVGSARALGNGRRRLLASRRCPHKTLPDPFYANAQQGHQPGTKLQIPGGEGGHSPINWN
jgi:hypothetical protein